MDNSLIPQGIELVQKAIAADNAQEHAQALSLYRDALARFTMGLKYEKNEARKKLILERVEGYMKRAEELSDFLKKQNELDKNGGGGVAAKNKEDGEDSLDAETKKLRGSLSAAIVTEKPNVKWDDVAGLENAKESLKEVRQSCLEIACLLACFVYDVFSPPAHLLSNRLSFSPPNFPSSSLANASPSRASFSMDHPERARVTSPRPSPPRPTPPSLASPVPT